MPRVVGYDIDHEMLRAPSADWLWDSLQRRGLIFYHGSPKVFSEFSYDFLGSQGTTEGKGFYFTSNRRIAEGYRGENKNSGQVVEAFLNIHKPLYISGPRQITRDRLRLLIQQLDPTGQDFLSNHGDVSYEGYDRVLSKAVKLEYEGSRDDVDVVSSLANGGYGGGPAEVYKALREALGFDGVLVRKPEWGDQIIAIAFFNDQIITRDKLEKRFRESFQSRSRIRYITRGFDPPKKPKRRKPVAGSASELGGVR